jgi:hypothetical protein
MVRVPSEDMVNVGADTVRFSAVVAVMLPEVPVTVKAYCPIGAELVAYKYRVLLFVAGLIDQMGVTPLGSPATDRSTLPEKPYRLWI